MKALLIVAVVMQGLLTTIPDIDGKHFAQAAVELDRDRHWRFGYVLTHHGAELVRAKLGPAGPMSLPPTDPLSTFMARELKSRPWKAAVELIFYCGIAALLDLGRRAVGKPDAAGRLRGSLIATGVAVFVITITMAPYLAAGYGEPLFSTWRGPGALSSSGLVPTTALVIPAVSYGALLQFVLIGPMVAAPQIAEPLSAVLGIRGSLWLVTAVFWGLIAGISAYAGALRFLRPAP